MLAMVLPEGLSREETEEFAEYFTAIGQFLHERKINIFTEESLARAISFFSPTLAPKLLNHMRAGSLELGISEVLDIVNEVVFIEKMYKYAKNRYDVDMMTSVYSNAILPDLQAWHQEMMILAKRQASYEEAYRATMRFVKEYWIHQPHKGSA